MSTRTFTLPILLICFSYSASQEDHPKLRLVRSPAPESHFIVMPSNVTVLEGEPSILRCKIKDPVQICQWFYTDRNLNILDESVSPALVKQFSPSLGNKDCSIRFTRTKLVQDGQWICKGLKTDSKHKFVLSRPVFLEVITNSGLPAVEKAEAKQALDKVLPADENTKVTQDLEIGKSNLCDRGTLKFITKEEDHAVNFKQDQNALLDCQTNSDLESCLWLRPDNTKLQLIGRYEIKGNLSDGNCSLLIHRVDATDEGNWRCYVSTVDGNKKLGPAICLHVLELGPQNEDQKTMKETLSNIEKDVSEYSPPLLSPWSEATVETAKATERDILKCHSILDMIGTCQGNKEKHATENRYDLAAKTWAAKLRELSNEQLILAEKLINDVLYEAELGNLNKTYSVDANLNTKAK